MNNEEALKFEYINIDDLTPYAKNARKHQQDDVSAIVASIKAFGFKDPVGVWGEHNIIVEGHGRLLAARECGLSKVPCIRLDELTDEQRRAYALAHNKTAELSAWDFDALSSELDNITAFDMGDFGFVDDMFGEDSDGIGWKKPTNDYESNKPNATLKDRFVIPPFSVLDSRQGYWADRVREWRGMIGDIGQARDDAKLFRSDFAEKYGGRTISMLDPVVSEIVVKWFMPSNGNKCFDPFAGDTVFGYVAATLGNDFTGIELREEQATFNSERTKGLSARYICDDGRNVRKHIGEQSQDLLFSCPPYYDLEVYSDKENDASNQATYEEFYAILDKAFSEAILCLKDDRFAVIVVGDVRNKKNGEYYDFPGDIKRTFKENGMKLYNDMILVNQIGSAGIRAARSMNNRKVVKVHQNVLVFYKGDTSKIKDNFPIIEVKDDDFCNDGEDE